MGKLLCNDKHSVAFHVVTKEVSAAPINGLRDASKQSVLRVLQGLNEWPH